MRNGTYGTGTHRRPRWKCYPPNADAPHEFTEALPRQFGASGFCSDSERTYDAVEGPQTPRAYSFTTKEIAGALEQLGQRRELLPGVPGGATASAALPAFQEPPTSVKARRRG